METLKVGVLGPAGPDFNPERVWEVLEQAFDDIRRDYPGVPITVVGYGMDKGIPGVAYHFAAQHQWQTIGIILPDMPEEPRFPVSHSIVVNPRPDDTRAFFFEFCHVIVRIGGDLALRTAIFQRSLRGRRAYEYEL